MTSEQKRALGIGAVTVVGFVVYKRMRSGSAGALQQAAPTSGAIGGSVTPYVPQTPIPVPAGESIYDPNNQALLTAPTSTPTAPITSSAGNGSGPAYVPGPLKVTNINVLPPNVPPKHKRVVKRSKPAKRVHTGKTVVPSKGAHLIGTPGKGSKR